MNLPGLLQPTTFDWVCIALVVAEFLRDRFTWLNAQADRFEDWIAEQPALSWFHYNTLGDPVSWVHHGLLAAAFALAGGVSTLPVMPFWEGVLHGAVVALVFYLIREAHQFVVQWRKWRRGGLRGPLADRRAFHFWQRGLHVGFGTDGFFDLWGPAAVVLLAAFKAGAL